MYVRDLHIYMEMDTNSSPALRAHFFFILPSLGFREAAPLLYSSAPGAALRHFPGVTQPLGGSREGHQLPLINRVGMPDVHLPEQGR